MVSGLFSHLVLVLLALARPQHFFWLIIITFNLSRLWRCTFYPLSPSAIRTAAARFKLPISPRSGLSKEDICAPIKP